MLTVDLRYLPLVNGDYILDLGCGEGRHVNAFSLAAAVNAIGLDLCWDDVRTAQTKLQDFAPLAPGHHSLHIQGDAMQLPFPNASLDKIVCSEVLEHIPDYARVLLEVERVLKPGGRLCISVPRYWPEKICWMLSDKYHQVDGGHVRIFKTRALRVEIEQLGLRFVHRHWAHALHSPYWWLKCLWWSRRNSHWLIKAYHRLLVWDLMKKPYLTRTLETLLNPVCGKSVVMYFDKPLA